MVRPVIVCVDDDPVALNQVEHELAKRYGADYELRFGTSRGAATALVQSLAGEGRDLALVIMDEAMPDRSGIEVLTQIRALLPDARRALLVGAWDRPMQASERLRSGARRSRSVLPSGNGSRAAVQLRP